MNADERSDKMKVFVAGGLGAIGRRLVPLLIAAGHDVAATTTSPEKKRALLELGAAPYVVDGLDRDAVLDAAAQAEPEVVVHEMTGLSEATNLRHFDRVFATTNRLRTVGTDHLLEAARAVGARRFVAQSFAGWNYGRSGPLVKTEEDPLDPAPLHSMRQSLAAFRHLESAVLRAGLEGLVLRYGNLYGPGTSTAADGVFVELLRKRRMPLIGDGGGIWSFLHVDDAAGATLAAVEGGQPGIYNICDDEPAPAQEWLPELAASVGAPPPRRVPAWLGRLAAGEAVVLMFTQTRGASNAKAKKGLVWTPRWPSWREGFREGLGAAPADEHVAARAAG
jgi:nucleoside-diphosphate-sugar epimerase